MRFAIPNAICVTLLKTKTVTFINTNRKLEHYLHWKEWRFSHLEITMFSSDKKGWKPVCSSHRSFPILHIIHIVANC